MPEELRVGARVGDDEVCSPKRVAVEASERPRGNGADPEALAVGDQRVVERHEGVEDDGPATRNPSRGG